MLIAKKKIFSCFLLHMVDWKFCSCSSFSHSTIQSTSHFAVPQESPSTRALFSFLLFSSLSLEWPPFSLSFPRNSLNDPSSSVKPATTRSQDLPVFPSPSLFPVSDHCSPVCHVSGSVTVHVSFLPLDRVLIEGGYPVSFFFAVPGGDFTITDT